MTNDTRNAAALSRRGFIGAGAAAAFAATSVAERASAQGRDRLVFALSVGAVPFVCPKALFDAQPRWKQMVDALRQREPLLLRETLAAHRRTGWELARAQHAAERDAPAGA